MITFQLFYRKYGIRLPQQLMTPMSFELALLDLPQKSIYHYFTTDGVEFGPPSDDYLFRNIKKPILIRHIDTVGAQLGNPRKVAINTNVFIRDYHNQNRRMRPLRNMVLASKDPTSLIVLNYCFINKTYKYVRSFFTEYHKWYNTFAAVIDNITNIANEVDNYHYLLTGSPKLLPSLQQLITASANGMTPAMLKIFSTKEAYFLLELWKWLGDNRETSLFNRIPSNKIQLVNIVYQESGKWIVLNLGVLNSFRKLSEAEKGTYVVESKIQLDTAQIHKRLLKMMMSIMEIRTITANVAMPAEAEEAPVASVITGNVVDVSDDVQILDEDGEPIDEVNAPADTSDDTVDETIITSDAQVEEDEDVTEESEESQKQKILDEDAQLDKDLAALNDIAKKQEEEVKDVGTVSDIIEADEQSLEDSIVSICDKLADDGMLTAGEYRRFTKLSSAYKEIIAPDGVSTMEEFLVIKPDDLKIAESSSVVDTTSILDKTMLKSSLIDFDSRYISKIMAKDTANAVMSLQRAGIAVTNYKVERVNDILGGYEMHMLKLVPVEGQASTIRFKLPIVEQDGTFKSNGIRYSSRKMKGDLPIRKVNYNKVALTSYYGKSFVNRGRRKSNDYGYWLQCNVMEKGLNSEDLDITEIAPGNAFAKGLKVPRAYSALSMAFTSINSRGFNIQFDRQKFLKTIPAEVVTAFEKDGAVIIGSDVDSRYLVLDKIGTVYVTENDNLKPLGPIERFLGIVTSNPPVEYADVVIFGKEVPIGVVLGYKIGLDKLIKLLKVEPRRVNAGSRLNMESNEYALAFSDETLIFSKDDRLASLILAGFNEYHRALRLFSVYSFDKRGVYMNLLDTANLGVRYLREIDLMYDMFIDPITKDLLVEMKEPVTFQGLLFRSCEMLLEDDHPAELDPAFMRIKGYERMSGAVYTELVQAVRMHNGKLGKANKPIEMNPYAVWKRISEDPSKSQVSEINPIKALKEMEAVTFAGTGGRCKRSMVTHTRQFHPNDMGTISESTVEGSDVAINVFTSANPQFTSLRGMSKRYDFNVAGPTALLSTSALLSPGSDRDDQYGLVNQ